MLLTKLLLKNSNKLQNLYEVFSFDSLNQNQLKNLAKQIIKNINNNTFIEDGDYDIYISPLNIPNSVFDMIAIDNNKDVNDLSIMEILNSPYTEKYLIKYIINEFKEIFNYLKSLGNPLTLYRFIDLNYSSEERNKFIDKNDMLNHILLNQNIHLGRSWTPNFDSAEEFGQNNYDVHDGIILQIECSPNVINLQQTLILRNSFTYYNYENEIELIKNSPILLKRIYKLDDKGIWRPRNINKNYKV